MNIQQVEHEELPEPETQPSSTSRNRAYYEKNKADILAKRTARQDIQTREITELRNLLEIERERANYYKTKLLNITTLIGELNLVDSST